jgi:predicted nucleic acid-binding protein
VIVLDTNVLSEALRPAPSARVLEWMHGEALEAVFTTTITQAELLYGVALLPPGGRKIALDAGIARIFEDRFAGRVLSFYSAAAREYAEIAASRHKAGRRMSEPDARIAAIARSRGARIATRNLRDFVDCGVELIDPWV